MWTVCKICIAAGMIALTLWFIVMLIYIVLDIFDVL